MTKRRIKVNDKTSSKDNTPILFNKSNVETPDKLLTFNNLNNEEENGTGINIDEMNDDQIELPDINSRSKSRLMMNNKNKRQNLISAKNLNQLGSIPIESIPFNSSDIENMKTLVLHVTPVKVANNKETNDEQYADNSINLNVNGNNESNLMEISSKRNKSRTRTMNSLEQKDESIVKPYKLRNSITKMDISFDNVSFYPIKESQTNPLEKKTSSQKRKSTKLESNGGNKIQRRVSSRIENLVIAKSISLQREPGSRKIQKATSKVSKPIVNETQKLTSLGVNDPGNWPDQIPDNLKLKLIKNGPVQIDNIWFPTNNKLKRFSTNCYFIKTDDGRQIRRNWLVYSIVKDAAFCFPCRIFASDSHSTLANSGCRNWNKFINRVHTHENSLKHIESVEQWAVVSIQNDCFNSISTLTSDEALKLAERLRQFASTKENKLYLTAKELEWELQRLNNPSG